jgi:hypothetical protein
MMMFNLICFLKCFFTFFKVIEKRFTFFRLFIMLNVNASIIAIFISDYFFIESKILNSLRLSLKSWIVFEFSFLLTDFVCFLSVQERLIVDWSKLIFFRERILMTIIENFVEFLVESSNLKWFDWLKKDFFSIWMFFFVCCFYFFRMRAKFKIKFDDVRFFMITDVVFTHLWFIKY